MIFKSPSSLERELDGIRDSIRVFMGKVATFWRIEDFPVDCQRHIGKATENHIFRQILRPLADRFHGDLSRFQRRVTVDTSADPRKGDGATVRLVCQRKAIGVTRLQQLRFAMCAAVPNRTGRVDDELCRKPESRGDPRPADSPRTDRMG